MDEPEGTYAPQSPDLSAYHSELPPQQQHSYYAPPPQTSYQPPPSHYVPPQPYYHQQQHLGPQSVYHYPPQQYQAPSNGHRIKQQDQGDAEWLPNPYNGGAQPETTVARPRSGKKNKFEYECDKPAPGEAEGIVVKTKFPIARIKRLIQSDDEVGKVAQTTPTGVAKALEFFLIHTVSAAAAEARVKSTKKISAAHLKAAVEKDEQLDFLREIVGKVPDTKAAKKEEDSDDEGHKSEKNGKGGGGGRKRKSKEDGGAEGKGRRRGKGT